MSLEDKGFPGVFEHPSAGTSELDARRLAVRWRVGAEESAKQALVAESGLAPATAGDGDRRPAIAVNHTDGLWWVERADGEAIDEDVLEALQGSELVEWVSPAYRAATQRGARAADVAETAVYAVNPTRIYVRRQSLEAVGGA